MRWKVSCWKVNKTKANKKFYLHCANKGNQIKYSNNQRTGTNPRKTTPSCASHEYPCKLTTHFKIFAQDNKAIIKIYSEMCKLSRINWLALTNIILGWKFSSCWDVCKYEIPPATELGTINIISVCSPQLHKICAQKTHTN